MNIKNKKGLTLIECLISILLLAVILIGGMSLFNNADEMISRATHKRIALEIANSKMDLLKSQDYSSITSATDSITVGSLVATRTTTVTPVGGQYKNVKVRVDWTGGGNMTAPQHIEIETYIAP